MFLSHTAPCSFHWGLSLTVNQWSCAILNFDLWGCFCFESQERGEGGRWRERTGNTTLIRRTEDELKSLKVWSRLHVVRGLVCTDIQKQSLFFAPWDANTAAPKNYTDVNANTLQRNMEGRNEGGGNKEKVSTGFSINSHFCKSMGRKGSRREEVADALQREKRGRKKGGRTRES